MRLNKRQLFLIGFMLFSLFFGAGNLIFPPFLGANAAENMPLALFGFLVTAVFLPVLGVIIIAKFNGLEKLSSKVNKYFAPIFTFVILLSIGPGLGIPRAASVPFEMAIQPYLSEDLNPKLFMLLYSAIFFAIALWLSLNPKKLVSRIGTILTPSLLILLVTLFISFLIKGESVMTLPTPIYETHTFFQGFNDGYQTMDTIAALNFGLVISNTLVGMGIRENRKIVNYTITTGIFAGIILSIIYIMLAFIGSKTAGIYQGCDNGAVILRGVTHSLFGDFGAIFIALVFTLACLTTCVGLITSISNFFQEKLPKVHYKWWVLIITLGSFGICNLGLNQILEISIPVLNAIYPMSIVLILLGTFDFLYKDNKFIYPITIFSTGVISIMFAIDQALGFKTGGFHEGMSYLWGYKIGFGWVIIAAIAIIISIILGLLFKKKSKPEDLIELNE